MQSFNQNSALMYPEPLPFWKGLQVRFSPFIMAVGLHLCVFGSALLFHYGYGEPVLVASETEETPMIVEYIIETEIVEPVPELRNDPEFEEKQEAIIEPQVVTQEPKLQAETPPPIEEEAEVYMPEPLTIEKPKPRLKNIQPQTKPQIKKPQPTQMEIAIKQPVKTKVVSSVPVVQPKKKMGFIKPVYPSYLRNPTPPYPKKARKRKQEGVVLLFVEVSEKGRPLKVRIKKTSGVPSLDRSALSTVKKWRFLPALKNNIAITANVIVPIRFQFHKT